LSKAKGKQGKKDEILKEYKQKAITSAQEIYKIIKSKISKYSKDDLVVLSL